MSSSATRRRQLWRRAMRVSPRRGDPCRGGRAPAPPGPPAGKSERDRRADGGQEGLAEDGLSTPRAGGTRKALAALLIAQRSASASAQGYSTSSKHYTPPHLSRYASGSVRATAGARPRLVKMRARSDAPGSEQLIFTVLRDLAAAVKSSPLKRTPTSASSLS